MGENCFLNSNHLKSGNWLRTCNKWRNIYSRKLTKSQSEQPRANTTHSPSQPIRDCDSGGRGHKDRVPGQPGHVPGGPGPQHAQPPPLSCTGCAPRSSTWVRSIFPPPHPHSRVELHSRCKSQPCRPPAALSPARSQDKGAERQALRLNVCAPKLPMLKP